MRIIAKGQVTIPASIREQLNLRKGDEVDFIVEGTTVMIVRAEDAPTRGERMVRRLRRSAPLAMGTNELMEMLRGEE
ncbi:AbrB/MazE/SpoVT family DNA-binding domain-containing protein [Nonomuraea sp. NPDC059194]|uniref:AbrB/MazE/SpoVT family DNA-binding domain-containing protein n=1 Tax=Nonomuraea sp. NPDC059194 TaxID=3346764 RepID=UPI0036C1E78B